jgi:hypothetical protein
MPAGGQWNCPPVAMRSAHFLTEPTASLCGGGLSLGFDDGV